MLFLKRVKFLGEIVGEGSVKIDPENFKAVVDWPRPKCTRDVESFLGFVNYHVNISLTWLKLQFHFML